MRARYTFTNVHGDVLEGTRNLISNPLADVLQTVLAFHNLESCTLQYKDGSHITYQAIEYECTACGSHEHADGECICETCDDWDNQAREDHPAECPTCGKDWGR